jgi:hypothetical protein
MAIFQKFKVFSTGISKHTLAWFTAEVYANKPVKSQPAKFIHQHSAGDAAISSLRARGLHAGEWNPIFARTMPGVIFDAHVDVDAGTPPLGHPYPL